MINEKDTKEAIKAFENFLGIIKKLREPDGCPWDKVQTPLSMRTPLVEEAFEAVDAITQNDAEHAKEELGDVLLNASMISYMYEQSGDFTIADEINELTEKLIRRHPHVFPQSEGKSEQLDKVNNPDTVLNQWDKIKENLEGRKTECVLDEVPAGFPPILKAFKYQKKAAKRGFDWTDISDVRAKVLEELNEVTEAEKDYLAAKNKADAQGGSHADNLTVESDSEADEKFLHVEEEIGDLFFAVVNYARKLGVDPEVALNRTNQKFYRRYSYVQEKMKENSIPETNDHLAEMDKFWDEAKSKGL